MAEQLGSGYMKKGFINDRRHHLNTYPKCFVTKELIDWLIEHKEASDREMAIKLMQKLVDWDIIHDVCDKHKEFKDFKYSTTLERMMVSSNWTMK